MRGWWSLCKHVGSGCRGATRMVAVLLLSAFGASGAQPVSPYTGAVDRPIKALSEQQTAGYLQGEGMGLAMAAELNGYPGPAHVLELAEPLGLSATQKARSEQIRARMRERAIDAGRRLVSEEQALDRLFAEGRIDGAQLESRLERIGELQARVRHAHLQAHLEQTAILSDEQVRRYAELRGYTSAGASSTGAGQGPGQRAHQGQHGHHRHAH